MARSPYFGALAVWVLAANASADRPKNVVKDATSGGGVPSVELVSGGMQTSIPIATPPYHGIEPRLGLHYSSDAGNGWVGVGWSLRGASVIERVSLGRGAAWFTDSARDSFVLDGEELWPCGDSTEGVCGLVKPAETISFVGKVGDYRRVLLFPSSDGTDVDHFEVQNGDGTKATYTAIRTVIVPQLGPRGVRFGVNRVEDVHGNSVVYEWTLLGDGAHPGRIAYNGNEVQFEWELRPVADQEKKANGASLDASPFRLRDVIVRASGAQRNRYRLSYDDGDALSPSTQRSRLRQVQVCGKSDSLCLPVMTYEYLEQPQPNQLSTGAIEGISGWCASGSLTTGDFTGDGRTDFACMSKTYASDWWEVRIDVAPALSDGLGFEVSTTPWFVSANEPKFHDFIWCNDSNEIRSADFNADGRSDLYCTHNPGPIAINPLLSRGFDFVDGGLGYHVACAAGGVRWAADFTGDGRAEQYCIAGGGASGGANVSGGWCSGAGKIGEGDFNGDGRMDLYCHEPGTIASPLGRVFVALSQGNPGENSAAMLQDPNFWIDGFCSGFEADVGTGDFNGDGKADLYCVKTSGDGGTDVALSVGRGHFERLATNLPSPPVGNLISDPAMDTTFWDSATGCDGHSWWYHGPDMTGDDGTPPADPTKGSVLGSGRSANVWDGWCYKANVFRGLPGRRTYRARFDMSVKIISRPPGWGRSGRFLIVSNDGAVLWADTGWVGDSDWAPRTLIIPNVDLSQGAGVAIWNSPSSQTLTYTLVDNLFVTQTDVPVVADFNGDGKDDLYFQQDEGSILVSLSTGAGPSTLESWATGFCPAGGWLSRGDFDGDGKDDLYCYRTLNDQPLLEIARSGDYGMTDMLRRIENGLGGTTEIEYRPSSTWGEPSVEAPTGLSVLPQPTGGPTRQTVISISTEDGRGNTYATEFRYAGQRYSWVERMPLGYRMVEIERCRERTGGECLGPYTQSWQGRRLAPFQPESQALIGRAQTELVLRFSEQGLKLSESRVRTHGFAGFPQQLVPEGRFETIYNAQGDKRVALETYSHDGLGQLIRRIQYGECVLPLGSESCDGVAGSGDELTTVLAYRPADAGSYIAGLPERVTTYFGAHADTAHEPPISMRLAETLSEYFDNGDLLKTREWLDTKDPVEYVETQYAYDPFGNLTEVTDAADAKTVTFYDATHHVYPIGVLNGLSEKNSRGHSTSIDYDLVCGLPRGETNLNDATTVTDYDELCRPTVTQGPGLFVTRSYTLGGALINRIRTEAQGRWSEQHFDGLGRVYKTMAEGSLGAEVTEVTFDTLGRVQTSSEPGYGAAGPTTSFLYDDLDRLTCAAQPGGTCTDAPGARVWTNYDLRTVTLIDEKNRRQESIYDAYGRLGRKVEYADAAQTQPVTTSYFYEWLPRRTTIRSPAGHDTVATSDSLGQVVLREHPDRGKESFRYDARGLLVESVDAAGLVHWEAHDLVRRPKAQGYRAAGGNVTTAEWQYGQQAPERGRVELSLSRDDAGTEQYREQYGYDLAGRIKQRVAYAAGLAYSFDYEYRADNQQLWFIQYPNRKRLQFSYDPALRVERIELDGQAIVDAALYDALGRLTEQRNGNGTASLVQYDPARGWLTQLRTTGPQSIIQDLAYVRDDVGNVLARESGVPEEPTWVYQYTAQDFLSSASSTAGVTQTFSYDPLTGNMKSGPLGSYQYGENGAGPHAVTSVQGGSAWHFEYDARGNMRSRNGVALEHDVAGRLVRAGSVAGEKRFTYGPFGSRVRKCDSQGCTLYLGDGYEKRIPASTGATQ
jgi:YD repeat-containing protein